MIYKDLKNFIIKVKIIKKLQNKGGKKNKENSLKKKCCLTTTIRNLKVKKDYNKTMKQMCLKEMKCGYKEKNKN